MRTIRSPQSKEVFFRAAETFQVLSDPTRLRILHALAEGNHQVGDLVRLLGVSASTVSHQLRLLRTLRIVRVHRVGRTAVYELAAPGIRRLLVEGVRQADG